MSIRLYYNFSAIGDSIQCDAWDAEQVLHGSGQAIRINFNSLGQGERNRP
jgi:hypothetical protein